VCQLPKGLTTRATIRESYFVSLLFPLRVQQ
jgi:hypothetical protein